MSHIFPSHSSWLSFTGACLFSLSAFSAHAEWDKKFYDPHPLNDDLVLPLPCNGAMVFRPIDIPTAGGVLDDTGLEIGKADTQQGYNFYIRHVWLAAPFSSPEKAMRRYYLGKYDVTQNQYNALMAASHNQVCPTPTLEGRAPITKISWLDAQDISAFYTSWLLAHAAHRLPKKGDKLGFIRLPTEEEWSYAARGGNKVSPADFMAPLWPMPEGPTQYIMAGTALTAGHIQPVGQMKPNPLGLYDMLGEAGQMMIEPYRLNRVGRTQGQAGGIVVRGGNYTFNPEDLFTAMREEIPPYDSVTHAPTRLSTMGMRFSIGAVTLGNLAETTEAQTEFDTLSKKNETAATSPTQLIATLKNQTADLALKRGLDQLAATLASNQRAALDSAASVFKAQIQAAAILGSNIWESLNTISLLKKELNVLSHLTPQQKALVEHNLANHEHIVSSSIEGYLDLAHQLHSSPLDPHLREAQFTIVSTEWTARDQKRLAVFLDLLRSHLVTAEKHISLTPAMIEQSIQSIPARQARASTQ